MGEVSRDNVSRLYASVADVLRQARQKAYSAVNFCMVVSYWEIGRLIVEDEQQGQQRADYGKAVLRELAMKLTSEFGKGFDEKQPAIYEEFLPEVPDL